MDKNLLDKLVCPGCKSSLVFNQNDQELLCPACKIAYQVQDDIPVLLLDETRNLTEAEIQQLQTGQ